MESHKIIQVEEKVPLKLLLPLSIQHMFAMFGASVLVPFIFGINPAIVLFMNGVGTLLFIVVTKAKSPAYLGSSFAFLAPAGVVISKMGVSVCTGRICSSWILRMYPVLYYLQMWNEVDRYCASTGSYGAGCCADRTGIIKFCRK